MCKGFSVDPFLIINLYLKTVYLSGAKWQQEYSKEHMYQLPKQTGKNDVTDRRQVSYIPMCLLDCTKTIENSTL